MNHEKVAQMAKVMARFVKDSEALARSVPSMDHAELRATVAALILTQSATITTLVEFMKNEIVD